MTEQIGHHPDQGPRIQRLSDFPNAEDLVVEERTLEFRFDPMQSDEERLAIAQRVFDGLYEGQIDLSSSRLRYENDDGTAFIEGVNISEKPEKTFEELTEEERETLELRSKYLISSEIPSTYRFMAAEEESVTPENPGPQIRRLADIADPEWVHQDQRVLSFRFGDEDEATRAEIIRKVFGLLYEGDLNPDILDLSIISKYVAFGNNITGEKEIKPEDEMTAEEREALALMNKHLTHSEFAPVRAIQ